MEEKLQRFLNKMMREEEAEVKELIVVGMAQGEEVPYTHAIAILRHDKDNNLIISDSQADNEHYWPAKPVGLRDKRLFKLGDLTDQYEIITLLTISKEIMEEHTQDQLEREIRYIMTGEEQTDAIKAKEIKGAAQSHKKRYSTTKKRRIKGSLSLYKSRK